MRSGAATHPKSSATTRDLDRSWGTLSHEGPIRPRSATGFALAVDVVEQHVIAQTVGAREEGPAAVHAGHLLDEGHQVIVVVEHERIYHDALTRAALHLEQRLMKRFRQRRIEEDRVLPFHAR